MDEQAVKQFRDYMIEAGRRDREQKYEKYRRLNKFCETGQILFTGSSLMEYFPVVEMTEGMTKRKVYRCLSEHRHQRSEPPRLYA